ncbi:MAG: AAA family ATPase [Lachnospiraceae bacterium]|nr:AAA family ATPase [Lachnospiraceae bacterium]
MYLNKLLLKDFGKFNNKSIDLKPGLNLIYGENEAGKTTIKEFIIGMLYGIDKSRGLGARLDNYELRKPLDGRGFSGKAYINYKGKNHLVERSFLRHNRKLSAMDVQAGRELKLKNKNSLHGTMFDLDKNTYVNTLCIGEHGAAPGKELANEMNNYLANLSTTGSADIDKTAAIERLKAEKKKNDVKPIIEKLDNIAAEIDEFKTVDEDLKDIRAKISELDQEFAMETAKRKREARKMVEGDDGEVSYEENYQLSAKLDNLAEQATAATEIEDEEPEEKLSDKIWFIILTGIFVIGVIAAMVHILPFSEGVRKLFIVCTFLFVIVTIVEGLYAKGVFQDDITTPSEEEFKRIIKELEKQAETSEDDVEIDMTFAKEYAEKKADLKVIEKNHLDRHAKKLELEEEFTVISKQRDAVEREVHAINLAINTINEMSAQIHGDLGFLINDNISDIVSKITDGKYDDVRLDENLHVMVRDGDSYVGIEYLSAGTMEQIYLAVRLSVARLLCRDKMPLIIDDIFTNYDEPRLINTLDCLKTIDTEQIILMTSNPHIGDMLDDLDMDYNYVELA